MQGNLTVGIYSFNATIGTVEYNLTNGDAIIVETAAAHYGAKFAHYCLTA